MHSPNIFLPVAACAAPPAPADLHKERGGAGGATDLLLGHLLHIIQSRRRRNLALQTGH